MCQAWCEALDMWQLTERLQCGGKNSRRPHVRVRVLQCGNQQESTYLQNEELAYMMWVLRSPTVCRLQAGDPGKLGCRFHPSLKALGSGEAGV